MDVYAGIVDQRLTGIMESHPDWFPWADEHKRRSAAFVVLCMSTSLDLPLHECAELLTEGGNDAGVDGLHLGDVGDGDFLVTLFQGKYKTDLGGEANFPENGVKAAIQTAEVLFDPHRDVPLNPRIAPRIEEVRSLIGDGYIPTVRFVLCNNGAKWSDQADIRVREAALASRGQLQLVHYNHHGIVKAMTRGPHVDAVLTLSGSMVTEDLNFTRVMVGRVAVHELSRLFEEHGDQLLERNIRRLPGRVQSRQCPVRGTLLDEKQAKNFYLYNNGITVACDRFDYNALQKADHQVQVKGMQVINGGQTCKTIHETLRDHPEAAREASVSIRLHQLPEESGEIVRDITRATNSQSPVDLRDLHSNDDMQKALAAGCEELGYAYWRHDQQGRPDDPGFTNTTIAEAVLAVWRERPQQAKCRRGEHFGKLYELIFDGLNAAQALTAALIFREVEARRRGACDDQEVAPAFTPYASHLLAMLIGRAIRADFGIAVPGITHRNFDDLRTAFTQDSNRYYALAQESIAAALRTCYGDRDISLQQLAATFRRGDLLELLHEAA